MKKRLIVLVFLLVICFASAEDYSSDEVLDLQVDLNNLLEVEFSSSRSKIKDLRAEISYFPKDYENQIVSEQEVNIKPAGVIDVDENVVIEWDSVDAGDVVIDISSKVRVFNVFKEIDERIEFPIKDLKNNQEYLGGSGKIDITYEIISKSNEIVAGEDDLYFAVFKLGKWVEDHIEYNLTTSNIDAVQKSSWVLANKEGVCDELTNLFISFCRAVGVPAKFISGVAYTNIHDDFGSHGWAEVYFPSYGWIPFDVTYGQFGWVDPSHVKLKEGVDSGESSAAYQWSGVDANVEATSMDVKTSLISRSGIIEDRVELDVDALESDIGFNSAVPLEVSVKNLYDYYLPVSVFVVQAPSKLKDNSQVVLLEPNEERKVYWIIDPPSDLERGYIYTANVIVNTSFGDSDYDIIRYGENFDHYSIGKAKEQVARLSNYRGKAVLKDLELDCYKVKEKYYSNESIEIKCDVKNVGNVNLQNVNVCLRRDCEKVSLGISQGLEISFEVELKESKELEVIALKDDFVKISKVFVNVIEIPRIDVVNFKPRRIKYNEEGVMSFSLISNKEVRNVNVEVVGIGDLKVTYLDGSHKVEIPVSGKDLVDGVRLKLGYYSNNERFGKEDYFYVEVYDMPVFVRIVNWFKGLF